MKFPLFIPIICILFCLEGFAQCDFTETGIGGFNSTSDLNQFAQLTTAGSTDYGDFGLSASEVQEGSSSLKIDVTTAHPWAVRMFNNSCKIPVREGFRYVLSFWIKGEVGADLTTYLYAGASSNNVDQTTLTIEAGGWEKHSLVLNSTETNDGGIKFSFPDLGTYYLDGLTVVEQDCNGEEGGSASVDNCDICSGGSTGIVPNSYCDFITISPDDNRIRYDGTLSESISSSQAILHRFSNDFLTNGPINGFWNQANAETQSGITINVKTNSPIMKFSFSELAGSEQRPDHFAVFKNGDLYQDNIVTENFTVTNFAQDTADWTISLSSFNGMVFNSLEVVNGFDLLELAPESKPQYFAIGNSITHGVGQDNAGHLTYPYLIAASMGFELHNLGIGGSRITDQIMTNFVGQTADVITVLWGYNDVNSSIDLDQPGGGAYDRYEALMDSLCKSQTTSEIYAILPTPTNTVVGANNSSNTIEDLRTEQENIVTTLQATCPNLYLVESHDYVTKPADLNDDVHLNIQGAYNLAMGLIGEIGNLDCNGTWKGTAEVDQCSVCSGGNTGVPVDDCIVASVDDFSHTLIYTFPNPSSGGIVKFSSQLHNAKVVNMLGEVIRETKMIDDFDTSLFPKGVYLIKAEEGTLRLLVE